MNHRIQNAKFEPTTLYLWACTHACTHATGYVHMLGMTASKITCFHFCNLFESACAQKECMVASSHMSLLSTTHVGALSGGRAVASVYTGADCYPAVSTVHVTTARPERLKSMHGISPLQSVFIQEGMGAHSGRHGENLVLWETVEELINCLGICCISSPTGCPIHYNG